MHLFNILSLRRTVPAFILLWICCASSSAQTVEPRLLRTPAIHGNTLVFSYAGDLWSAKVGSSEPARHLTSHPGLESRPKISPDGKWIAFNGAYDGPREIYVMPIEGGQPRRLTFEGGAPLAAGWTPDGKIAYMSSARNFTARQPALWYVKPEGGLPIRTPILEIFDASFFPDGKTMAYSRTPAIYGWRRYRGGQLGKISLFDFTTNGYSELPAGHDQRMYPMAVGRSVYYLSDRDKATLNLFRYDLDSKHEAQLTHFSDADIRWPDSDGRSIVWERDGFLEVYDIATAKVSRQSPRVISEQIAARSTYRQLGDQIQNVSISPTGTTVAVEARGEIFTVPAKSGDVRNLTRSSGAREELPRWSPDGKTIAYLSDVTGEREAYTQPAGGGQSVRLTNAGGKFTINYLSWSPDGRHLQLHTSANDLYILEIASGKLTHVIHERSSGFSVDWSPDSKWLALTSEGANRMSAIYLFEIASGRLTKVTEGLYSDNAVAFDQNGKYLYVNSSRTFNPRPGRFERLLNVDNTERLYIIPLAADYPNPLRPAAQDEQARPAAGPAAPGKDSSIPSVRIDLDGLADRMVALPTPAGNFSAVLGGRNSLYYVSSPLGSTDVALERFDLDSRTAQTIYKGPGGPMSPTPDRTKLALFTGGKLSVFELKPGVDISTGRVDTSGVAATIDPRQEWRQIFWDTWRFQRDSFYDPNMVGLDWQAIGKRYEKYLPFLASRLDLNYVLEMMLSELGTSHTYVSGGDAGQLPAAVPVGHLGADYEVVDGHVRFARIYYGQNFEEARRGPLGEPGYRVNEGEYLLAIDGEPVDASVNPDALLLGKADRYVTITVNSRPAMDGARQVRVRTVASEADLRYFDWSEAARRYVARESGGRIGYMHLPNILVPGMVEFIRGFYSQTDKDAMIVDERWNGGGYLVQQMMVDTLIRTTRLGLQQRNGADFIGSWAIEGPKVMLVNEYAGSGGDSLPWTFKVSGAGKLVGRRTMGALVGVNEVLTLIDGGEVTSPGLGLYDRQNNLLVAENVGVEPDIEVDMRPDLVAKGQDPQLDAAIHYLMDQLKKRPPAQPRKDIPQVQPGGRVGR